MTERDTLRDLHDLVKNRFRNKPLRDLMEYMRSRYKPRFMQLHRDDEIAEERYDEVRQAAFRYWAKYNN